MYTNNEMLDVIRPSSLQHLSISNGNIQVDASFMQTLWNVHPICSGSNIEEGRGGTQKTQKEKKWNFAVRWVWVG